MATHNDFGKIAEDLAAEYLQQNICSRMVIRWLREIFGFKKQRLISLLKKKI